MPAPDDVVQRVVSVIFGVVIVTIVLSTLTSGFLPADGSVFVGTDNRFELDNADGVEAVKNSTGRAAALNQNTEVQISGGIGVDGDEWHWSTYARVQNTSRDQVVWSVRDDWLLAYDGDQPAWVLWHYNASSTNSYRLSVPAADASSLTNVQASRNGTAVTLYNSSGTSASLTLTPETDTSASAPVGGELVGALEETRTWDRELTGSERQALRNEPLAPIGVGDRDARLMFDQEGRDVAVDLRSASGEIVGDPGFFGGLRGNGLPGERLQRGADYQLQNGGIELLQNGTVYNAPRIAIEAEGNLLGKFIGPISAALQMLILFALAIAGAAALKTFRNGF